jgi:uncharacterized protein (DUF2267 family)
MTRVVGNGNQYGMVFAPHCVLIRSFTRRFAASTDCFTMPMNEDTMLTRLQELAPFADRNDARRAFDATLQAMRRGLNEDEADWLAVALGPSLSTPLLRQGHQGELSADELYRWTKRYGKTRKGVAIEQAQVVCRALGELLQQPECERLKKHLPEIAALLEGPPSNDLPSAPRRLRIDTGDHSLAGGRPGSSRPLSEAGGPSERALSGAKPELAHAQSAARAYDPHPSAKLASARGFAREREAHSQAGARQGGGRG